jgi:hypothetical protein
LNLALANRYATIRPHICLKRHFQDLDLLAPPNLSIDGVNSGGGLDQPNPQSSFSISSKADIKWLQKQDLRTIEASGSVARMIWQNAQEVVGAETLAAVENHIVASVRGRRTTGVTGIRDSIAETVAAVARSMGWNMDSPQVVYMSTHHVSWSVNQDYQTLQQNVERARSGERRFISQEARDTMIAREQSEAERLLPYRDAINYGLARYVSEQQATGQFPQGEQYLDVLRFLIYQRSATQAVKKRVISFLQQGKIAEAYQAVLDSGGVK